MRPILFYAGPVPIYSYGLFMLLGMVMLFVVALKLGRQAKLTWEQLGPVALGVLVGGMFGARLSQAFVEPDKAAEYLNFFGLFQPGTPGNLLGLMIGGYLGGLAVRESLGLPANGNFYAPATALAGVIWRVGCTLAGCCYGYETDVPWAIVLENVEHHPTMVYEGFVHLGLLLVIWRLWGRAGRPLGDEWLFFYFASFAFARFWLEFIRLYPKWLWGMTGIQWLCIGLFIGSVVGLWRLRPSAAVAHPAS